ncbi:hypothetical protein AAE02nite_09650 [Adhaeribacter aerolatus]|uniref:DUF3575 domain-containing protein n=1 Tax=Adhaeribacter aerolatus TaxID=670289 RepID=A0A512AUB8_9BACT|nr:hypothetical protein [Adhaeribacter aerolatus]GEO03301.1 hypothetical protein AAE02nite_09650 [Adhaeribacter aerolatus]
MKNIFFRSNLLLILLLFTRLSIAQEPNRSALQFRFSPLSLFDPRAATIQLGIQGTIQNKIGLSVDYGIPYKGLAKTIFQNPENRYGYHDYYKLRAELKYFMQPDWLKGDEKSKLYFSAEAFHSPEEYQKIDSWLLKEDENYYYEYSDVNRQLWGGCIKVGQEYIVFRRLILDNFVGLGLRWITIDHQIFGENIEPPTRFSFGSVDNREGSFTRPHLALGAKIGFVLVK